MKNKQIAENLHITAGTVKVHLMHIFEKTGLKDRLALAVHGRELIGLDRQSQAASDRLKLKHRRRSIKQEGAETPRFSFRADTLATSTRVLYGRQPRPRRFRPRRERRARGGPALLTPSLSDCFFVAIMMWLFVCGASGWKSLLMDGDTGWHIRTGEYILAHHAVPTHDLFSFSKPDAPWFAWEWLSDVLLRGCCFGWRV